MSERYSLIRAALATAQRKDWSEGTPAMLDALAVQLESDLTALSQQPAPVSATEPEGVTALRSHVGDGNESLYSGRQRVVCDAVELLAYIDSLSATPPKVRKSGRKDPMVLCKSCQHMIDNDEWHDCPELNKKLVRTLEQENATLRARVAELERVTEEQELLDFMEQQGTSWSPAPFRAVRGTEWAVRAEHDIGDTPTLREVLRIARVRALTAARGGG